MGRSSFVVISEDQSLIQKAQQFGQMHGVTVQVMAAEQWESMQSASGLGVPSLISGGFAANGMVSGSGSGSGLGEGAKVLPFPGTGWSNGGASGSGDPRKGVATINQLESVAIENAIQAFKGNLTEAAKALGIGRATLYRKVKQYNIDPSAARKKKAA